MEDNRFDDLTVTIGEAEASRRSLLQRAIGGGVAAALAAVGITGLAPEEAEAKRRCRKRCKKKNSKRGRRRCRRRCRRKGDNPSPPPTGFPINIDLDLVGNTCTTNDDCGAGEGSGLECAGVAPLAVCTPIGLGDVCTTGEDCDTGSCLLGLCNECDALDICGDPGDEQCCVADAACIAGICVLES